MKKIILFIFGLICFIVISLYFSEKQIKIDQQVNQFKIYKSVIVKVVEIKAVTTNGDACIVVSDSNNNVKTINLIGYPHRLRRTAMCLIKAKTVYDLIGKDVEIIYEENVVDEDNNLICVAFLEVEEVEKY